MLPEFTVHAHHLGNLVKMQIPAQQGWAVLKPPGQRLHFTNEAGGLSASEVHTDHSERRAASRQGPDSQPSPACHGLGSLQMIIVELVS